MTLKSLKKTIISKFDKTVKAATSRAIPIAKKEAARVMKSSTAEKASQIIEVVKIASIGGSLMYGCFGNGKDSLRTLETAQNITITIENLVVNL